MTLDLTEEETAARELEGIITNDRYFLPPRVQTLKASPPSRPVFVTRADGATCSTTLSISAHDLEPVHFRPNFIAKGSCSCNNRDMTLQAYIDDSGNDPTEYAFVLAGFVAPAENWARFSQDWKALLDRPPGAGHLKTAHAYSLQEEFHPAKGWTRPLVNTFMLDAAEVINTHAAERFAVWVRREHFDKHLKSLALPYSRTPADHPYFLCFYLMILTIAALHSIITTEPCDFIFDEQSAIGENALGWWGAFKWFASHGSKTDFSPFLGSPPIFGNDKTFIPLQAADLYAWHLRAAILQNKIMYMPRPKLLERFKMMTGREEEITEQKLINMRDLFAETAKRVAAADPTVSLSTTALPKRRRPRAKWFPSGF